MRRELVLLSLISLLALGSVVQAANIIWVSDNKGYGSVEPNKPGDQGWIDLLTAQGHNVVYKNQFEYIDGKQYWRTLDPNKVAELEAADLIILSRNADSGSYSTAADNEPNQWNAVSTPLISLSAHMSRVGGKWGWLNGTGTTKAKEGLFNVVDADHAVFSGVAIDPNGRVQALNPQWNVDWVTGVVDAGNGKVLATRASDGLVSIVTWEAGQKFFEAGTKVAGGPRMLFVAGTGSSNAAPNYAPDGMYNLTADGEKMFVNAVNFMLNKNKAIVFVSSMHASTADANVPSDQGFVDLLRAAGYDVDYTAGSVAGTGYWEGTPDPNKFAVLDAADLVILGRDLNSAGVADSDAKRAAWNGVKTPMMLMSSYIAANNRFKWVNINSQDARKAYFDLKALDPNHPVFEGVTLDPNNAVTWYDPNAASGYASFINSADAGSGKVLAVRPDNGNMLIAEWPARQETYATSGQLPANVRMLFSAGTQEVSGQKTNWGVMNLNAEGQKIFLNAVAYLLQPMVVPVVNASFEQPGTVKIKGWNGEGIAGTPAVDIPGWASDAGVAVADSGVESDTRYPATDGKWTAFMKGADPSIWQLTNFVIQADDVFVLKVDARITWNAKTLKMSLYYDAAGVRTALASQDVALTNTMQPFTLEFAAKDVPASVGAKIGIEFDNVTTDGNSWAGLDNVSLTLK